MGRLLTLYGNRVIDPRTVPGLALWIDPADYGTLTFNGSNISQAANKGTAGVGPATQGTAANQPLYEAAKINGRPALTYNNDALSVADHVGLDYARCSAYVVVQNNIDSGSTPRVFSKWSGAPNNEFLMLLADNTTPDTYSLGVSSDGTANTFKSINQPATGTAAIISMLYDGTTTRFRVNNNPATEQTVSGAIYNGFLPILLGATFGNGNFSIADALFYTQLNSAAHCVALHQMLSTKMRIPLV